MLGLPADGTPCRKTFEWLYRGLAAKVVSRCFIALIRGWRRLTNQGRPIAIDGKTLRGSHWQYLCGIVCVEGRRLDFATGKQSVQRRYYLISPDPWRIGPAHLGELVRRHESIENNLHWCDVTLADDAARVHKDHGQANLAAIKRHALGLAKRATPKANTPLKAKCTSLKTRRLRCGLDDPHLN